jgi:hypothetical protein
MKAICVDKVKNLSDVTVAYTLELEDGKVRAFAPDVLKCMMHSHQLEVLNLQIQNNRLVVVDDIKGNKVYTTDELVHLAINIAESFNRAAGTVYDNDDTRPLSWCFFGYEGYTKVPKFKMYVEKGRLKAKKINDTRVFDMHREYDRKTMSYLTGVPLNSLY